MTYNNHQFHPNPIQPTYSIENDLSWTKCVGSKWHCPNSLRLTPPLCQTGKHGWFCSIGSGWICKQRCTNTFYTQSIDASDWWHFPACKDLRLTATKCEENAWWYNLSIQVIQVMQVMQVIRGIQVMKVMKVMQAERVMWVRPAHLWVDFRV